MAHTNSEAGGERALGAGNFYGAVEGKHEQCGAIFTNLKHAAPRKLPSHAHELAFFALLLEGEYGECYEGRERQFRPFTIHFRPAGIPHQDEVGPHGVRFLEIEIQPNWRQRLADYPAALDLAHDDCNGGPLLWLGMKMCRELWGAGAADDLTVESLLAEMLAQVASTPREEVRQSPAWLGRVIEKLTAEYSRRLTLDELSREAGVHPVHLSRVFRKCLGEGIGEHVHRLRIRAACEQMLTREIPMSEISLAAGYADQSHFTRAFRRATGMTPAAFRGKLTTSQTTTSQTITSQTITSQTSDSGSLLPSGTAWGTRARSSRAT